MKREKRVKREGLSGDQGGHMVRKAATLRLTSLVSISLKQAAKNAFNLAIP